MTQEIYTPQFSKTDHFIKKICRMIFLTFIAICSIPIQIITIIESFELFLSSSKTDLKYYALVYTLVCTAIAVYLSIYFYKKIYKQYGYWLLIIMITFALYAWLATPFFHTIDLYYKTPLSFLERFHFNPLTISIISEIMKVMYYLLAVSYFFLLWVNIKYHIKNRKIKKSRK